MAAFIHDILYWCFRWGLLDPNEWLEAADEELRDVMELYGESKFIANIYMQAVDKFGHDSADPKNDWEVKLLPNPQEMKKKCKST